MKTIWTIMRKELARVFRDPKLIFTVILLPGLLLYGLYTVMGNLMQEDTPELKPFSIVVHENLDHGISSLLESLEIEVTLSSETVAKEKEQVKLGVSQGYVYADDQKLYIVYDSESYQSQALGDLVEQAFKTKLLIGTTNYQLQKLENVIDNEDIAKRTVAGLLPFLIMTFLFQGAMSVGPESIAGDKERGTIATLLATPTKRKHIAIGKIFSLSILAILSSISSFLGVIFSMSALTQMGNGVVDYGMDAYALILLIIITTIIVIISVIAVLSATAKNIKEASMISMPLMLISMVIGILTMNASMGTSNHILYLIPLYNSAQSLVSVFNGHIQIVPLLLTFGSNLLFALLFGFVLAKQFNSEKMMFSK